MDGERKAARELERQREENERAAKGPQTLGMWKRKLYDKIPFSVQTMDGIIWGLVGLIVLAVIVGIAVGNR